MPANHSNTNRVITILIHSDKMHFQKVFVMLLHRVAKDVTSSRLSRPQIFDVIANENARYKHYELELNFIQCYRKRVYKVFYAFNSHFTDKSAFCIDCPLLHHEKKKIFQPITQRMYWVVDTVT